MRSFNYCTFAALIAGNQTNQNKKGGGGGGGGGQASYCKCLISIWKNVASWMPNLAMIVRRYPLSCMYISKHFSTIQWFASGAGGIHREERERLRSVCRHKHLHAPPDSDPHLWDMTVKRVSASWPLSD